MINNVFLGLGSNKGDRLKYLKDAIQNINENENCTVLKFSSVYETSPYGIKEQEYFFNAVIEIETSLDIKNLFNLIKEIEKRLGRKNGDVKWGPREIDIDILFYNDLIYNINELTVPHKEILLRDFVLVPLKEIAPDFKHPVIHKKISEVDITLIEKHILRELFFQLI